MKIWKRNLIILIAAVLILLISIIVFSPKKSDSQSSDSSNQQQTWDVSQTQVAQNQTWDTKQKEKSPTLEDCKPLTWKDEKIECINTYYYYQATETNDPKICEKITDELMRWDCRAKTLLPENNWCNDGSDACKKVADIDDVIKNDDVNACLNMWGATLQASCLKKFLLADQKLGKMDKTCSKITNANLKKMCMNNYYLMIAQNKKDSTVCAKITDPLMSEICSRNIKYEKIASVGSVAACDIFKDAENKRQCVVQKTIDSFASNPKLEKCDIFSWAQKQTCIDFYYVQKAISDKDKSLCSKISMKAMQDYCQKTIK